MVAVDLGGVVLAVDDADPIGVRVLAQFDFLTPTTTAAADVTLRFEPGFVAPPDGCVEVLHWLWVDGDQLFIDATRARSRLHPAALLHGSRLQRYQAHVRGSPLYEPTEITVYYDDALVTEQGSPLRTFRRCLNAEYATAADQLARRLLTDLVEPLVHQRLLATGAGFMRVGAVADDDGAVLFSGWGGVGKSVMSSELLFNHGYRFLGDPLVVVTDTGAVHPYRKRISVTPRSIAAGEASEERLLEGRSPLDRVQWQVRSRLRGPTGVRRRVLPSTQYGELDPAHGDVPLRTVVMLVVEDRDTIAVEEAAAADVADRAASTIEWQFRTYSNALLSTHAAVPDRWPCMETVERRSARVYERALDGVDTYLMYVPPTATVEQRVEALFDEVLTPERRHVTVAS